MVKLKLPSFKKYTFPRVLVDLVVVFFGVFLAFLLNNWNEERKEKNELRQKYEAIYEDLNRFHDAGTREGNNFVLFFQSGVSQWDSIVQNQLVPPSNFRVFGDWYHIELIEAMIESGHLNDLDIQTFKNVSRFRTIHNNFMAEIDAFNRFYETHVTPQSSQRKEVFYHEDGRLKEEFEPVSQYIHSIAKFAELTVELSEKLKNHIKEEYLE